MTAFLLSLSSVLHLNVANFKGIQFECTFESVLVRFPVGLAGDPTDTRINTFGSC